MEPNKSNQISRLVDDDNSNFTEASFYEPVLQLSGDKKSLSSDLVNPITENKVKSVSRRIDYNFYCIREKLDILNSLIISETNLFDRICEHRQKRFQGFFYCPLYGKCK